MNQLVCELCGSTDIMKDGGVFVCQQCGCKYSLEEARKLMGLSAGTVDVSGSTVKIDSSSKLNNLYILARRAKETQNNADAIRYYHDIQVEDPNSWEAAFYGVYFTALDCKIGEIASAAMSIGNCLESIAKLILNYVPTEEQKKAYTEMLMQAVSAEMLLFTAAGNTFMKSSYSDAETDFSQRSTACLTAMQSAIKVAYLTFKDYHLAMTLIDTAMTCCNSNPLFSSMTRALRSLSNVVQSDRRNAENDRRRAENERKRAEMEKRINAYWAEHAEEKQRYDARLAEIDAELAQLQAESNRYRDQARDVRKRLEERLPEEQQVDELKRQHFQLVSQKAQLGLFAGKQKRELQEQIDGLTQQIEKLKAVANDRRNVLKSEVDAKVASIEVKRQPIAERMQVLSREKKQITAELTKDR